MIKEKELEEEEEIKFTFKKKKEKKTRSQKYFENPIIRSVSIRTTIKEKLHPLPN